MTVPTGDLPEIVSTEQLSELLGITQQRINQFKRDGLFQQFARGRWQLIPTVNAIIRHYGEVAAGRGDGMSLDLTAERASLTSTQREFTEIKIAQLKKDLVNIAEVEELVGAIVGNVRARLLAMPAKLAPIAAMGATQTEFREHLIEAVHVVLSEMADAEVIVDKIRDAAVEPEDCDSGTEAVGDSEAATENDGERVGGRKQASVKRDKRRGGKVAH